MSPRSEAQWQEMRTQSREKILSAALELFAERGFHNTTIQQIAKKAEVAKGLIYRYFESKEDLLIGIIKEAFKEGDDYIAEMEAIDDPQKSLEKMLDISFDYIKSQPHHNRLLMQLSLQLDQFPAITDMIVAKYHANMPLLENLLAGAGIPNPKLEANFLIAVLDGIGLRYMIFKEAMDLDTLKQELLEKYCEPLNQ
ncbi:MAG: helix-turn-helix domain-containing protein [Bacteroidota bacterium]